MADLLEAKSPEAEEGSVLRIARTLEKAAGFDRKGKEENLVVHRDQALPPRQAADCMQDIPRTVAFLRGTYEAVMAREGGVVRLSEVGCGPLAPLALSVACIERRVRFALVDIHAEALSHAQRAVEALGLQEQFDGVQWTDASHGFLSSLNPHVVAYDTLRAGLLREGHGAVTLNLAKEFPPDTIYVPNAVEVGAFLKDPDGQKIDLGCLVKLGDDFRRAAKGAPRGRKTLQAQRLFSLPPLEKPMKVGLSTEVHVHGTHRIPPNASILTSDYTSRGVPIPASPHARQLEVHLPMGESDLSYRVK